MKIEYNNLYTHFVLTTFDRSACIKEQNRIRIEKYITGIVNNNSSKLYAIYANPEHVHILVSRSPDISEQSLVTIIADSSEKFINQNNLSNGYFKWQQSASAFSISKTDIDPDNYRDKYILISRNTTKKLLLKKNMKNS